MKKRILARTAVLATLIGISQIASADGGGEMFTPVEKLPPEIRQQISESLRELTKEITVDWEQVIVGINEEGDICFRSKNNYPDYEVIAGFSCYPSKVENPNR